MHFTDSGKDQSVHTLMSSISLLSLFSPIAGEGFTCLDHSMLSKKNALSPILICTSNPKIKFAFEPLSKEEVLPLTVFCFIIRGGWLNSQGPDNPTTGRKKNRSQDMGGTALS